MLRPEPLRVQHKQRRPRPKMPGNESRGIAGGALLGVAVLLNLILTVLLIQQVVDTRRKVDDLSQQLATKQDVAMLRPLHVEKILHKRCTSCHTDRRFGTALNMGPREIIATVERMQGHPGANIPTGELRQIEAALTLFRCTSCHDGAVLNKLVLMPSKERLRFLRRKVAMPGSGFRPDQVGELLEAFEVLEDESLS